MVDILGVEVVKVCMCGVWFCGWCGVGLSVVVCEGIVNCDDFVERGVSVLVGIWEIDWSLCGVVGI